MAQPTSSDVHVDAVLTNVSTAYIQDHNNFVASQVFAPVRVAKQTDKYFTYTKADWFRDEAALRADGTESQGSGYGLSTATYSADVYALHKDVGDQARDNADAGIDLDRDATEFVTQRLLLRHEMEFAATAFTTGIWDTDIAGASLSSGTWENPLSDPVGDVDLGRSTIQGATGFTPNTLVVGYNVHLRLKNHPDIVDRFKYTSSQSITNDIIARVLDVDRYLVCMAVKNTAAEGAAGVYAPVMDTNDALLCYANPSPSLLAPSAGYTFVWQGTSGGLGADVGVSRFRMDHLKADRIEAEMAWDTKIVGTDLGYFFNEATA